MKNNARNVKDNSQADKGGDKDKQQGKKFDKKKYRLQKYSNKYKSMYTMYSTPNIG